MAPNENEELPGWVILSPAVVPEGWRARAITMMLVPLLPSEAVQLLSDARAELGIEPGQLPLVRLVARARSASEIARELGISSRTVNRHVARLKDHFGVSTIQELATELARRGF